MDRSTHDNDDVGSREPSASRDLGFDDLRALVGDSGPAGARRNAEQLSRLTSLVGSGPARTEPARPAKSDLSRLVGEPPAPATASAVGLAELVGDAVPRRDDARWSSRAAAAPGRRPRSVGRSRGNSPGVLSIVAAVAAVAVLAGTTTFAVVQRATSNPATEAMNSLREREADLQNEIKGLQTSIDLLESDVEDATAVSQSAATVLPGLDGRAEAAPLDAAKSARVTLDTAVAAVPVVIAPTYERPAVDEESLASVGSALDGVRRVGDGLPPLVAQARTARSGVAGALEDFRARLRDLGSSIQNTAARLVEERDAADESFRTAVSNAAAGIASSQQAGGDGLAEMTVFASAVDALNAENERVLQEIQDATPPRSPSSRPTTPPVQTDPGGSGSPDPNPSPTDPGQDPGTGGSGETPSPDPTPSETSPTQTVLPLDPLTP